MVLVEKLLATGNTTVALALDGPGASPEVRRLVAGHPDSEMRDARRKFNEDMHETLRTRAPGRRHTSEPAGEDVVALLADEDPGVVEAAAALPVPVMNRLLDEAGL